MSKIKLEILDDIAFRVAGKTYPRGNYLPEYAETATDENGVLINQGNANLYIRPIIEINQTNPIRQVMPFKSPRRWTDFVDANGDDFADFQTFTDFVTEMLALPNSSTPITPDYLSYVVFISQTSTNNPTVVVKQNNLGITISYTYIQPGEYLLTFSSAILSATNFALIQGTGSNDKLVKLQTIYNSPTQLKLQCYDLGNVGNGALYETILDSRVDGILTNMFFEFRLYE